MSTPKVSGHLPRGAAAPAFFAALGALLCFPLAALAPACDGGGGGGGGETGAGGSGGGAPAPPLLESCEAICDNQAGLECNTITLDQCKQQCPFLEQQVGACKSEYEALYACNATLDYECMQGYPFPVGAEKCTEASYAVSTCVQETPCRTYCKEAASVPCGPADEEACVTQCLAEGSFQSGGSCSSDLVQLRSCQGQPGALECAGDVLVTAGCDAQIQGYASCVSSQENDWCEGYCFAVEAVGCAPGGIEECLLACQADKHAGSGSCDYYYEDLLACRVGQGITCPGGVVSDDGCTDQLTNYQTCLMP